MSKEIGAAKRKRRPSRATGCDRVHKGRHEIRVHVGIHLISRPCYITPVKKRIARDDPQVIGELKAQVYAHLGHNREGAPAKLAAIARDREQAGVHRGSRLCIDSREAADGDRLMGNSQRYFCQDAKGPSLVVELSSCPDLTSVELIASVERIADGDGISIEGKQVDELGS